MPISDYFLELTIPFDRTGGFATANMAFATSSKTGQFFSRIQVYRRVGPCPFDKRFSFVEYVVGGSVFKSLAGTLFVEAAQAAVSYARR